MNPSLEKEALLAVLRSPVWGTVGPRFLEANLALAKTFGTQYALLTFSATAALESILRGFGIGAGDEVIVGALSDPADASVVMAVGAAPRFCDSEADSSALSPFFVRSSLTPKTKAIVADLPCDVAALRQIADEHGLKLILNLLDCADPRASLAHAAFVDMSVGCRVDLGLAGAAFTDSQEDFDCFYAHHNCGRPMGDGATLSFDETVGGDLRIAEWQAALLLCRMEDFTSVPLKLCHRFLPDQPVFAGDYAAKQTGRALSFGREAYPNAAGQI